MKTKKSALRKRTKTSLKTTVKTTMKSRPKKVSPVSPEITNEGIVTLLLKDHRAMKELMSDLREERVSQRRHFATFRQLDKLVHSHMIAEEKALLEKIKDTPKFEDEAQEGIEEHEIHRVVIKSIHQVKDPERRLVRMRSFCEILEHHLREEEEELFPLFKKYTAKSTRQKIGREFLKTRKKSNHAEPLTGALDPVDEDYVRPSI